MTALSPVIQVASTFLGVAGALQEGRAAQRAANYRAAIAMENQKIAVQNAERARERARIEQQEQDDLTRAVVGEQTAAQGASGIRIGSRSFALTRKAAHELGRLDALNVINAGEVEAHSYLTDAMNFGAQAGFSRLEGQTAKKASNLLAFRSLISGFSALTDNFQRFGLQRA